MSRTVPWGLPRWTAGLTDLAHCMHMRIPTTFLFVASPPTYTEHVTKGKYVGCLLMSHAENLRHLDMMATSLGTYSCKIRATAMRRARVIDWAGILHTRMQSSQTLTEVGRQPGIRNLTGATNSQGPTPGRQRTQQMRARSLLFLWITRSHEKDDEAQNESKKLHG